MFDDDDVNEQETKVKVSFELVLTHQSSKKQATSALSGALKSFLNNEFEDGLNGYLIGYCEDKEISCPEVLERVKHFSVK